MSDTRDIVERLENEAKIFEQTLLDDTVDLIREAAAEIARLREDRRWVPVGERLPEIEERVDVAGQGRDFIAWRTPSDWRNEDEYGIAVTHWRKRTPRPEGDA